MAISIVGLSLERSHAQDNATYTLTMAPPERGTVTVSPEMPTYPEGTEVTLTAVPDDGQRFVEWSILRDSTGNENRRGGNFQTNPYTFVINHDTTARVTFAGEITDNVYYDNIAVRGDDPNGSGSALKSTFETEADLQDYPLAIAQHFRAGMAGNVTAVELGIASPGESWRPLDLQHSRSR